MARDTAQYIAQQNLNIPDGSVETVSTIDDHMRDVKRTIKNTLPRLDKPVDFSQDELNALRSRITFTTGKISFNNSQIQEVAALDQDNAVQPRQYNDTRYLVKSNNLSDLPNKTAAWNTLVGAAGPTEVRALANMVGSMLMPVGTVYQNAQRADNPANYLGFGSWQPYAQGRTVVGAGSTNDGRETLGWSIGQSGGQFNQYLTIAHIPAHSHTFSLNLGGGSSGPRSAISVDTGNWHGHEYAPPAQGWNTSSIGSGAGFNIMQPFTVSQLWIRVG